MNKLDHVYTANLTDEARQSLIKTTSASLTRESPSLKTDETLRQLNTIVGFEVFDANYRKQATLGQFAPLNLSKERKEKGRFGLPSRLVEFSFNWTDIKRPPEVTYSSKQEQ